MSLTRIRRRRGTKIKSHHEGHEEHEEIEYIKLWLLRELRGETDFFIESEYNSGVSSVYSLEIISRTRSLEGESTSKGETPFRSASISASS